MDYMELFLKTILEDNFWKISAGNLGEVYEKNLQKIPKNNALRNLRKSSRGIKHFFRNLKQSLKNPRPPEGISIYKKFKSNSSRNFMNIHKRAFWRQSRSNAGKCLKNKKILLLKELKELQKDLIEKSRKELTEKPRNKLFEKFQKNVHKIQNSEENHGKNPAAISR